MILQIRFQDQGKNPVAAANCRVPATPAAVKLIQDGLFLPEQRRSLGARSPWRRTDFDPCPGGVCQLAGLIVVAYPASYYNFFSGGGYGGSGGWGSSMGDTYEYSGEWDPGTPPDAVPCSTGNEILDSDDFTYSASVLWRQSNYSPDTPQSERLEKYAWIVKGESGYLYVPMNIPATPCGMAAGTSIQLSPPPGTVAFIHTHPWTVGEVQTTCGETPTTYLGIPSPEDWQTAKNLEMPGYIIDADHITKFDGTGTNNVDAVQAQVARCGY